MADCGVIIIGRNEGARLVRCLQSIPAGLVPVVYVDSGSTDGSAVAAREAGAAAIELCNERPFTAARARNAGLHHLLRLAPGARLVQFVDGDCELAPDWIDRARQALAENPRAAIVCGRLRERYPEASVYNRLCQIEWDGPVGEVEACGGIFIGRVAALKNVGAFDETLIAGEEPDLCLRLRLAGWRVVRITAEMAAHDAAMTEFGQWWKRAVRSGHATAEALRRHGRRDRRSVRRAASAIAWGALLPAAAIGAAPATSGLSLMLLLAYPLQWWRVRLRAAVGGPGSALSGRDRNLHAFFTLLAKFAALLGIVQCASRWLAGRSARIIEYKHRAEPAARSVNTREQGIDEHPDETDLSDSQRREPAAGEVTERDGSPRSAVQRLAAPDPLHRLRSSGEI